MKPKWSMVLDIITLIVAFWIIFEFWIAPLLSRPSEHIYVERDESGICTSAWIKLEAKKSDWKWLAKNCPELFLRYDSPFTDDCKHLDAPYPPGD